MNAELANYPKKGYSETALEDDDIYEVILSSGVKKNIEKCPAHIRVKLEAWVCNISARGWFSTKLLPGYRDKKLVGTHLGQRSIRLSRSYRAIYRVVKSERSLELLEVSKHEY